MVKVKLKKRIIISILAFLFFLICSYNIFIRHIIDVREVNINVESLDSYALEDMKYNAQQDFGISNEIANEIINNPDQYRLIVYEFDIKNKADVPAYFLKITPIFSFKTFSNIVAYNKIDGEDPFTSFGPYVDYSAFPKFAIVRKNGFTDEEFKNMAKNDKFVISYFTGYSLLDIGYNILVAK